MVTRSEAIPSKWLKADDFVGKKITVTISYAQMEKMGMTDDEKLCVYFQGKDKGIALNKTNANYLFDELGEDTEEWEGKRVMFFVERKTFQGKMVNGFSFDVPQNKAQRPTNSSDPRTGTADDPISSGPAPRRAAGGISDNADQLNDDIPF